MTPPTTHREIERKFRVHALFELPDLTGVVEGIESQPVIELSAVYHDTAELTLFRWKVTLRRREGGLDAGWHLKLPVSGESAGVRDELHAPLSAGGVGSVPAELADIVAPMVRDKPLVPVVRLRTRRTPHLIRSAAGAPLVELVDDVVSVLDEHGASLAIFRELELELLDHDSPDALETLDHLTEALLAVGAEPGSTSKAAAALGPRAAAPADVPELPMPGPSGMAADAIRATIARHVRDLILADIAVRRDLPDAVHQVRVSARRLRSVLRTFDPLLDHEWALALEEELAWLADEMGLIRDTEVLEERLLAHAAQLDAPDAQLAIPAIRAMLDRRVEGARSGALAALRSDRHTYLIDDLIDAARVPKLLDGAYQACEDVLPDLVAEAWKSLVKSTHRLEIFGPAPEWHRARIKAKRARYAVDAVLPVFQGRVRRLAKELAQVTEVLGDHQDAWVAQEFLRELAATTDGSTGYALGLLHGIELEAEMTDRYAFADIWDAARDAARHSGLL